MNDSNRNLNVPDESGLSTAIAVNTICKVTESQARKTDDVPDEERYPLGSRLTEAMIDHVIALIRREIVDHFGPKYPGGQRAIAEEMFLAQSTLNRLLKRREGVGLDLVLALRAYLAAAGRPMTIDEILGLTSTAPGASEAPPDPGTQQLDQLVTRMKQLEEMVMAVFTSGEIKMSEKKKLLDRIQRSRMTAAGTRDLRKKRAASR